MNKNLWIVVYAAIVLATIVIPASGQESDKGKLKNTKGALLLFDGKTLNGWYTFIENRGRNTDPKEVFTVKEGMIKISGEEWGSLTSNEEFENYRLVAEYRWGDKTFVPRIK